MDERGQDLIDTGSNPISDILVAELPTHRIQTSSDVVVWALHRYLVSLNEITFYESDVRLPSEAGRCSFRYHLQNLELDFQVAFIILGRYLLVHTHIADDRNIYHGQIALSGISPDLAGLRTLIRRRPLHQLVDDMILTPITARTRRIRRLSVQEAALLQTIREIDAMLSVRDPYQLLCVAVHSLFHNENLRLIWLNDPSVTSPSFNLCRYWTERKDFYQFGYLCPGYGSEHKTGSEADLVMKCLPFHSAGSLIVIVQSNLSSSEFPGPRHAKVALSVKRFVDASMRLQNLPLLISIVSNSVSRILWMPVSNSDSLYLPSWILLSCLSFLTHQELCRLRSVNPYFRQICLHPFLWKSLCQKQFGWDGRQSEPIDWKCAFITKWRRTRIR